MEAPWVVLREKVGDARRWCLDEDGDARGGAGWAGSGYPGMVLEEEGGVAQGWWHTGRLEVLSAGAGWAG